jgi:hypothetical protein
VSDYSSYLLELQVIDHVLEVFNEIEEREIRPGE